MPAQTRNASKRKINSEKIDSKVQGIRKGDKKRKPCRACPACHWSNYHKRKCSHGEGLTKKTGLTKPFFGNENMKLRELAKTEEEWTQLSKLIKKHTKEFAGSLNGKKEKVDNAIKKQKYNEKLYNYYQSITKEWEIMNGSSSNDEEEDNDDNISVNFDEIPSEIPLEIQPSPILVPKYSVSIVKKGTEEARRIELSDDDMATFENLKHIIKEKVNALVSNISFKYPNKLTYGLQDAEVLKSVAALIKKGDSTWSESIFLYE